MDQLPDSDWFTVTDHAPDSSPRIFCFPHAGGNPLGVLSWQPLLGGQAQLVAVCPPGRGHRIDETAPADVTELADRAADAVGEEIDRTPGRPTVLFGHSLGAMLAFEVARRLADSAMVEHLVASGCAAPCLLPTARVISAAGLTGPAFAEAVGYFGGLPPEIAADEDLQEVLLPDLRADFALAAGYEYRPAPPLTIGVSLVNGRDDPHVRPELLDGWAAETPTAPVRHWADGGHFYFQDHPEAVTNVLRAIVEAAGTSVGHSTRRADLN
jgi:surfactin synthase thioesterase subunit